MPVLSRAHIDAEHFEDQTLQIPVGSGPYRVAEVKPGQGLVLERDPNYWAKDLPISRGLYNFDRIRIDYYRDATAMFEAFKAGLIDYRVEDDPNRWRNDYDFPAARDGRVIKAAIPSGLPKGVSGFAFNTRRPPFADIRVREALASMFDFEWINANLYAGAYKRSEGFFDDSELSSIGRPASDARAGAARALSRRGARRRDGRRMARPGLRRLRPRPRDRQKRARRARRRRLFAPRRPARRRAWRAARLRDPGQEPRRGAPRARLRAQSRPHRGRRERAARRRSAVPAPAHELRLRHDDRLVDRLALARQRAARPLELGGGQRPGRLQHLRRPPRPRSTR